LADDLDVVQSTLQQKIGQQRVRAQAARTPATSNPQLIGARASYPAPVPTPPAEPPSLTRWTWAGMLAHVDLLPQCNIRRHVHWAPPYDGHQGGSAPYEPLGLTRTGRAPFLLLLKLGLHVGRHVRLPHLARGLIPVPYWPSTSWTHGACRPGASPTTPLPETLVYLTAQLPTPSSKSVAKTSHSSLTHTRR